MTFHSEAKELAIALAVICRQVFPNFQSFPSGFSAISFLLMNEMH